MTRHVVTLNAGSSSIKFALFEVDGNEISPLAVGLTEMVGEQRRMNVRDSFGAVTFADSWSEVAGAPFHADALSRVLAWRSGAFPDANVIATGHRVVHGAFITTRR